jgi:hypothetical protein
LKGGVVGGTRDKKQSICVVSDFGDTQPPVHETNNYVYADNAAQRLSVKLTNPILTMNKGAREYSEPFASKKDGKLDGRAPGSSCPLCSGHSKTGQLTSYKHRTDHELTTR